MYKSLYNKYYYHPPLLQVKTLRDRKSKYISQSQWWGEDLKSSTQDVEPTLLTPRLCILKHLSLVCYTF